MLDADAPLADRVLEAAGIGGWEFDIAAGQLCWSRLTFAIHDVPLGTAPDLESAIEFYAPEARPIITAAVQTAMTAGTPWDLELPLITALGRRIWVRACGRVVFQAGRAIRLTGSFEDITARREIAQHAARLSLVVRQMTNAVIITDVRGHTEWVNDAFCTLTGYSLAEMKGRKPATLLQGPGTDPETVRHMSACLARGEGFDVEILNYSRDGAAYWMSVNCTPIRDAAGILSGFIAIENDITARREAEQEMLRQSRERQRTEALLRDVLDALPSAVTAYDAEERLILANRAYREMFPLAAPLAVPGQPLEQVLRAAAAAGQYLGSGETEVEREAWLAERLATHRQPGPAHTLALSGGRFVLARERRSESGNLVCVRTDTSELHRAQAALRTLAERDGLTGLANRVSLMEVMSRALRQHAGTDRGGGALMVFDVDHFKQINDTLGHDVGDAVLVEVAARLKARTRSGDVAARLGGDEFAVMMPGLTDPGTLAERLGALQAAIAAPMQIGMRRLVVTISAGAARYPDDAADEVALFKNADLALYEAKRSGRARWCAFQPEQAAELDTQNRLAVALREALADGQVTVAFQPKVRLKGGHAGFEALARWQHEGRWIPPSSFVPVAESAGLTLALGKVVLEASLSRLSQLQARGLTTGRVAVNVTGAELLHGGFLAETLEALRRHGLGPADLEFEITETVLLGRAATQVEQTLRGLRAAGIALALDDFGTGFASLSHLSRLPIDRIKIDRSFVSEIGLGGKGGVIARAVIGLARSLELESIAEGVETEEQLAFLREEGCDSVQGYLFSRPLMSLTDTSNYLQRQHAIRPRGRHRAHLGLVASNATS